MAEIYREEVAGLGRREVRKGRRGAALGTLRVGDPALGTVGRCRSAKAASGGLCVGTRAG